MKNFVELVESLGQTQSGKSRRLANKAKIGGRMQDYHKHMVDYHSFELSRNTIGPKTVHKERLKRHKQALQDLMS